jgi:MFS family permease
VGLFGTAAAPALRRNVLLDVVAAVGVGITTALVASLLPTVARREGLDPIGLATLASAPFVANLLGLFAGRFGPRSPHQLAIARGTGALLLVAVVLLPVPIVLAAVAVGFWVSISFASPLQQRLWAAMYPARERGRLIGVVSTGRMAAAGSAALVGGLLADRIGGLAVVAFAGALGAACALGATGLRTPAATEVRTWSARASWAAFRSRPGLRRIAAAQVFYGGGLIAAIPLYALVQVDRLSLSLAEVGMIGILAATASTLSCMAWGAVADQRGGLTVIQLGSVLGAASLAVYALAPSVVALWVAAVLVGVANAAIDLGLPTVVAEHAPLDEVAAATSGMNALTGARGLVAPFVGSLLVQAGIVDVTVALLGCTALTALGSLQYWRLGTGAEPRPLTPVLLDASERLARASEAQVDRGIRRARALVAAAAR